MDTSQSEDLQLGDLYTQVTGRLPGTEVMGLEEFLEPPDENFDVEEPDLPDIIADFSEESPSRAGGEQGSEDDQDEYIFGPPLDILSRVEAVEYMHKALQFAQHQEGITERDLRDIERIGHLFSRLQIDGRKQRKVILDQKQTSGYLFRVSANITGTLSLGTPKFCCTEGRAENGNLL